MIVTLGRKNNNNSCDVKNEIKLFADQVKHENNYDYAFSVLKYNNEDAILPWGRFVCIDVTCVVTMILILKKKRGNFHTIRNIANVNIQCFALLSLVRKYGFSWIGN